MRWSRRAILTVLVLMVGDTAESDILAALTLGYPPAG